MANIWIDNNVEYNETDYSTTDICICMDVDIY
jgi:hypothetical protein